MSNTLYIEISDTPQKWQRGLMFVKDMKNDMGMLFKYPQKIKLSFWGANTYIPLDIAFIKDNIVVSIKQIKPLDLSSVGCDQQCDMAVQANAGFFNHHKISPGFICKFGRDDTKGQFMNFVEQKNELV